MSARWNRSSKSGKKAGGGSFAGQFTRISLLNRILKSFPIVRIWEAFYMSSSVTGDHLAIDTGRLLIRPQAEAFTVAALRVRDPLLAPRLNLAREARW